MYVFSSRCLSPNVSIMCVVPSVFGLKSWRQSRTVDRMFLAGSLSELTWLTGGTWRIDNLMPNLSSRLDLGVRTCRGPGEHGCGSRMSVSWQHLMDDSVSCCPLRKQGDKSFHWPLVFRVLNFTDDDISEKSHTKLVIPAARILLRNREPDTM